jgi:hypothetical protein
MNIGPKIASKKFAIFSWARRALFCGWRVKVCQQEVKNDEAPAFVPAVAGLRHGRRMTKAEGSPNAQMTKSKRTLLSSFGFRHFG